MKPAARDPVAGGPAVPSRTAARPAWSLIKPARLGYLKEQMSNAIPTGEAEAA